MTFGRLFLVRFEPAGRAVAVSPGTSLLEAARRAGIRLDSNCSGQGDCGECGITILKGQFSPLIEEEQKVLSESEIHRNRRLACCTRVFSEAQVQLDDPGSSTIIEKALINTVENEY